MVKRQDRGDWVCLKNILVCADELRELQAREKEMGKAPDPELDAFMKAEVLKGKRESIVTEYIIRILNLDVCAETLVGNQVLGASSLPQLTLLFFVG